MVKATTHAAKAEGMIVRKAIRLLFDVNLIDLTSCSGNLFEAIGNSINIETETIYPLG
jgi:hypothetical protein